MHATAPSANLPDIFRAACSAIAQLDTGMPITPPSIVRTRPSLFTAALADIQRNLPEVLQPLKVPAWAMAPEFDIDDVNGELQILANSALLKG